MSAAGAVVSPRASVQLVLQKHPSWPTHVGRGSYRTLSKIEQCRTAAMGYHHTACNANGCDYTQVMYHSCRNRHCPNCGNSKKEAWIESRLKELLPCKYYHVVFTLPHELNPLVMGNRKQLFDLLFDAASYTLLRFAADEKYIGAKPGIIAVLHTWGQTLSFHPHLHCIVSGGGAKVDDEWIIAKKAKYGVLFPVQALEKVYKAYFLKQLRKLREKQKLRLTHQQELNWKSLLNNLFATNWIVYAKQPFGGPLQVMEYLGRYTHKVAISNHRIKEVDDVGNVTFTYKDYADKSKQKVMQLKAPEFIRRFEQHLLPFRFVKIRHYGYLGNNQRKIRVNRILQKMHLPQHPPVTKISFLQRMIELTGRDPMLCPDCKKGRLVLLQSGKIPSD